jgi:hypothetical protein
MSTPHATVLNTPAQINGLRALMILRGLEFEMKCPGMRLTGKAPKCTTILKRELGFKGSREKIYYQYLRYLDAQGIITLSPDTLDLIEDALN